jgi:hypothetical protein
MATIVAIVVVVFAAGAAAGVILLVSWGIHREERDFSLTSPALDRVTHSSRRVTGLAVRLTDPSPALASREDMLV